MTRINETRKVVNQVLLEYPLTRDNDDLLVLMTLSKLGLDHNMSFADYVLQEAKNYPSFETITRCRRLLQDIHSELRGSKWYERHAIQKDYVEELSSVLQDELNLGVQAYKEEHGL